MIFVIASVEIVPGKRDEFLAHFHAVVPLVLKEQGCIEYGPTVDIETSIAAQGDTRDNLVVIVEKWESIEALEDHLIAPHMLEYRKKVKEIVVRSSLQILKPA